MRTNDTIAAIASAPGDSEIGVIRISGVDSLSLCNALLNGWPLSVSSTSTAFRCDAELELTRCGGVGRLPVTAYLWPSNRSYTGQPSVELRTIGSAPVLEMVLETLFELGARPAQRGEFTLRAFLAGRLDLAQADAVLGVIEAADFQQLTVALQQLAGGLSARIGTVRSELLNLLADLEAGLDFVDEDIEFIEHSELVRRLDVVRRQIETLHRQADVRMQSHHRLRVVLGGLPNAGKSTLFNVLVGRAAAIVSDVEGTTRDYLAVPVTWSGIDLELLDTAGVMPFAHAIDQAAQQQRDQQFERADLVVWCRSSGTTPEDQRRDTLAFESQRTLGRPLLLVTTKCDLSFASGPSGELEVSAATSNGLIDLQAAIVVRLQQERTVASELVGSTAARSRESLRSTVEALGRAMGTAQARLGDEFIAIEIREALEQLGQIVGAVYTDDILDRIFSRFCIGK